MSTAPHPQSALLQEAIAAALAGDKATARDLLAQITIASPKNEVAWLWLASVSTTTQELMRCWREVTQINPQQEQARQGLKRLLLQEGVNAAKNGDKEKARALLRELTELDSNCELAWLWLATLAKDIEEATQHTLRVLRINPDNERAKAWIEKLQPSPAAMDASSVSALNASATSITILSSSTWNCPLCGTEALSATTRCAHCRAVVSLTSLDELLNNAEVDRTLVQKAVQRLDREVKAAGEQAEYHPLFNLGLAYLNLGHIDEGTKFLRQAAELKLKDEHLKAQVEMLLQKASQAALAADAATADIEASPTPSSDSPQEHPVETSGAYTILMVDDSPTIRKLVSITLSKYGHEVVCASNGLDALNKLKEVVPDLILSDISMPHMDGYQLCKMIRSNSILKQVPIIMLSGKDGIFDKLRGRMVGATAYITKPFEIDGLLQLIDMHCQQAAERI